MYEYIIGRIDAVDTSYITVENNNIGYKVIVSNPYSFEENKEYKIYLYQQITQDDNTLFGFKDKKRKDLFLKLINVKGLGPKMAIAMFSGSTPEDIISAIENENISYLKKFPKIGDKVARQIILDLKGKLVAPENKDIRKNEELIDALKALGYKIGDINKVIVKIKNELPIEEQVKEALKLLLK